MHKPIISLIAAIGRSTRVIGNSASKTARDQIPWRLPLDQKYFKETTTGHVVIMGRTTFESVGKPLPNRTNIVVTKQNNFKAEGCIIAPSTEIAIKIAQELESGEIFIIGGGLIYTNMIKQANRLYLTLVEGNYEGDVFFPEYSDFQKLISSVTHHENEIEFTFVVLER